MLSKYFSALVIAMLLPAAAVLADQEEQYCSAVTLPDWYDLKINEGTALEGPLHSAIQDIFSPSRYRWTLADPLPWRRAMQHLMSGTQDAALPILKTEERAKSFEFIGPIGQFWTHFIENSAAPQNNVLVTSNSFKIVEGYEEIVSQFSEVIWAETNERAWRIFEMNRSQYALLPAGETNLMQFATMSEKYLLDSKPPIAQPLYMMIRKDSHCTEDIPAIESAISQGRLKLW